MADTKSVQLTDDEIKSTILNVYYSLDPEKTEEWADKIERMKYLNKRLNDKEGGSSY